MRVAVRGFLLGLALLSFPASALAQGNVEEARAAFEQAEAEFSRGNFALALQGFQQSYDQLEGHPRRPLVLYNIGRCYEELGRHREARDAYQRYLREAGDGAIEREDTEARIRELETRVSMEASPATPSGSSGSARADRATSPAGGVSPIGPVVLGAGGAMLVAGAILGAVTLANRDELTAMCDEEMRCPSNASGFADEVSTLALTTDILLFGGAAVAAAGLILTLVLRDDAEQPSAALSCADSGCMAFVQGAF